jgi:hypothetical protein
MATFHFLDDGFTGRLGTIVGSSYRGKLYVKRYHKPTDADSDQQREVRALFRHLGNIARQIQDTVFLLNRPKIPHGTVVSHLIHINKPMFDKLMRRQTKAGVWDRWHPELFQLTTGILPPIVFDDAEVGVNNVGEHYVSLHWEKVPKEYADYQGYVIVYDDDCETAVVEKMESLGTLNISVLIDRFANMTTWENIHVYLAYVDGAIDDGKAGTKSIGRRVSVTAYTHGVYTPPTPPTPPSPTPSGVSGSSPGDGLLPKPAAAEAATLRDEAARLMEEAKRLEAEANIAGGVSEATA